MLIYNEQAPPARPAPQRKLSGARHEGPKQAVRPLLILEPLIKKDLDAAHKAGLPHYRAAGEKMIEAQVSGQMKHVEFKDWLKRIFNLSYSHAAKYMQLAKTDPEFILQNKWTSLSDFVRGTSSASYNARWAKAAAPAYQEGKARNKTADQIVDIGFKTLAKELHPDKGGSNEDMRRLIQAREDLKKRRHVTVEQSGPTESKPWWNQDAQTIARQMAANMTRDKISHLFALAMDALKTKQAAA